MGLFQLVLVLALAAVLLPLGIRGLMWRHMREHRLRIPGIKPVEPDGLPEALAPIFEAAERSLLPLGFTLVGARWADSVDICESPRPERVYRHAESGAFAFVGPPLPGMCERPYRVGFVSCLRDDSVVVTFDGLAHLTPGFPPSWICFDHDVNDLGKQWALHLHALEPRGGLDAAASISLADWCARETKALADTIQHWETVGLTRRIKTSDPSLDHHSAWRFRGRPSWTLASQFLRGQRRVLAAEAEQAKFRARQQLWRDNIEPVTDALEPGLVDARAAAMEWGYQYGQDSRQQYMARRSSQSKWWVGLASGAACLLVFGWWLGWELAWILTAVLLIHELGHLAAMEAFGYRDRRILFIPFFGAATLGEKVDASPEQRTLVYMLGPAPGILLGLAALYGYVNGGSLWWLAAATASLLVNYLNLLPISPLDGGRIVETLLLGRFPRAQVAFIGGGSLVFAIGAWVLRDPILAGISLALVISLRNAWVAAGALVKARQRIAVGVPEAEQVRNVFDLLQEPPYSSKPAAQRVRLAEVIIPRLGHAPASLRTAVAGGIVYLIMLLGVPVAVAGSVYAFAPDVWESFMIPADDMGATTAVAEPELDARALPLRAKDESDLNAGASDAKSSHASKTKGQPRSRSISEASLVGR